MILYPNKDQNSIQYFRIFNLLSSYKTSTICTELTSLLKMNITIMKAILKKNCLLEQKFHWNLYHQLIISKETSKYLSNNNRKTKFLKHRRHISPIKAKGACRWSPLALSSPRLDLWKLIFTVWKNGTSIVRTSWRFDEWNDFFLDYVIISHTHNLIAWNVILGI